MSTRMKIAAFLTLKLLLAGAVIAQAQSSQTTSQPPAHETAAQTSATASQDEPAHTAPVLWITSVEVMRSTHAPQLDVVRVRALAATEGWQAAELVPLTHGVPSDGMLDLAMVAEAPEDSTAPAPYPEIEAVFTIEPGHPFKGVRVHGASNSVSLHTLPGYEAAPPPPKDCTACEGKLFLSKGKGLPAGATTDAVHEEELPRNLRVIHAQEGINSIDSNPNRMTILLDENDRIITVIWD
ncbi:hypothetical protein [Silvibacterium acidisoli]|uniref:hypothetical protein n=1 Tax=Acidobacteriaceae bacterium ZG23-2 TaxID=2883246 RepID=UPI00406C1CE2